MKKSHVLITGGAGYIGAHVLQCLSQKGLTCVVLDNLSTGFKELVQSGTFIQGDVSDTSKVTSILQRYSIESVIHFAASTCVPESVSHPIKYYDNNTLATLNLLKACHNAGVKNFVFSSTAAVYGQPRHSPISENTPPCPINPYGRSKWFCEQILDDYAHAHDMRVLTLRYFNVAGACPDGRLGQKTQKASHLIKVALETALGLRPHIEIFGQDYDTFDGTCIRDFIHVSDLAQAHRLGLEYLSQGGSSTVLNCGYGQGYSVRQVIDMVQQCAQKSFKVQVTQKRAGDPPCVVACPKRIQEVLDWHPRFNDLHTIIETALNWEMSLYPSKTARAEV